ncbi:hypothetical protein [Streptomyces sp. NPDC058279]|uniref:hypothetical protein n=1 Tax=Streptomyces sp. NPDC058279 TaxID=3346418 RepID=UPI0036E410A5
MPAALTVANTNVAVLSVLLAAINAVQVVLGRQLVKPSASKRPPRQLRIESAAAAVAMGGGSLLMVGVLTLKGPLLVYGGVLMLSGFTALTVARKRLPGLRAARTRT